MQNSRDEMLNATAVSQLYLPPPTTTGRRYVAEILAEETEQPKRPMQPERPKQRNDRNGLHGQDAHATHGRDAP